jgi:hypothetical protein
LLTGCQAQDLPQVCDKAKSSNCQPDDIVQPKAASHVIIPELRYGIVSCHALVISFCRRRTTARFITWWADGNGVCFVWPTRQLLNLSFQVFDFFLKLRESPLDPEATCFIYRAHKLRIGSFIFFNKLHAPVFKALSLDVGEFTRHETNSYPKYFIGCNMQIEKSFEALLFTH